MELPSMNDGNARSKQEERRAFTRVTSDVGACLAAQNAEQEMVSGRVEDVSMNGMFLRCQSVLPEGARCRVRLPLQDDAPAPAITVEAVVTRVKKEGLAIQFLEIDITSFEHLRNLVLYNASIVVQVEQELVRHRGISPQQ